jgi:hypothetical protein
VQFFYSRYPSTLFGGQNATPMQAANRVAVQEAADTWEIFITDNFVCKVFLQLCMFELGEVSTILSLNI